MCVSMFSPSSRRERNSCTHVFCLASARRNDDDDSVNALPLMSTFGRKTGLNTHTHTHVRPAHACHTRSQSQCYTQSHVFATLRHRARSGGRRASSGWSWGCAGRGWLRHSVCRIDKHSARTYTRIGGRCCDGSASLCPGNLRFAFNQHGKVVGVGDASLTKAKRTSGLTQRAETRRFYCVRVLYMCVTCLQLVLCGFVTMRLPAAGIG